MDHTNDADHLRRRAASLRDLAARLATTPARSLEGVAGTDTWDSPRAELCRRLLRANQAQLVAAVEDLHGRARQLDRRADQLELSRQVFA